MKKRGPNSPWFLYLETCKICLYTALIHCSTSWVWVLGFFSPFKANMKTYASSSDTSVCNSRSLLPALSFGVNTEKQKYWSILGGYLMPVLLTADAIFHVLWDWVGMRKFSLKVLADHKSLNLRCCAENMHPGPNAAPGEGWGWNHRLGWWKLYQYWFLGTTVLHSWSLMYQTPSQLERSTKNEKKTQGMGHNREITAF